MVTISDVLASDGLALTAVHLPRPDAEVRWVATSELIDPTPFLEGGELLLTTGLETVGWRSEWRTYIDRLLQARVAALGLGVGLTHRRPPTTLISACRHAGLNLFQVPRPTPFVAISRATVGLLDLSEEAAARETLGIQRLLTKAAMGKGDTKALLHRLAEVLDGETCVVSSDGVAVTGPIGPARGALDLDDVRSAVVRMRPQGLQAATSISARGSTMVLHPLGLRGRPNAYLAAYVAGRPSQAQRSAVTTAVSLLSLAADRSDDRRETDRRFRGRALELLVDGEVRTARLVLAARTGQRPEDVELPAHIQVVRATGGRDVLDDALSSLDQDKVLAARVDGELWLLATPERVAGLAEALAARRLRVGVGEGETLSRASRSHATAGHALGQTTAATPLVWWDRMMGEGAMAFIDHAQAAVFAESYLGPLTGESDTDLISTLKSFLRNHGMRGRVAEELGVHRNTVRNRMETIEKAIGGSLDDPQVRVNAWIALQVRADVTRSH